MKRNTIKLLVVTYVSQAIQRIESDPNTFDRECHHMECSTAEGCIQTVVLAEAEHAQNNLFWWSIKYCDRGFCPLTRKE